MDEAPRIDIEPGKGGGLVYDKERRTIVAQGRPDDLCTAPGAADLSFGGLLVCMIRAMFVRVESLAPNRAHRYYFECTQCKGTDNSRPIGQRPAVGLVEHTADCYLGKHLPRLHAMANKDVT